MRVNVDIQHVDSFRSAGNFSKRRKKRKASHIKSGLKCCWPLDVLLLCFFFSQLPPSVRALSPPPHRINNVFDFIKSNLLAIWPLEPFVVWFIHFFLFFCFSFFLSILLRFPAHSHLVCCCRIRRSSCSVACSHLGFQSKAKYGPDWPGARG